MMPNAQMLMIFLFMWYALAVSGILFLMSGIDDLFIDIYYWVRMLWRAWKTRHYAPLTYEKLIARPEQTIAILIPCWHEANVIATMLLHNTYAIDYKNYHIFVGVYPNDLETIQEVSSAALSDNRIHCVVGDKPGPSNKAANLNNVYANAKNFEKALSDPFQIFVFHDSEDVIHPLSFKLYNYLMPHKDMIQIPVFPLEVGYWNFTHWLYADEFSEIHTKDIIVRESIKAHVPSAGVGTAFSKSTLELLAVEHNGAPFSIDSLTEDYRTSLWIRMHKLKQVFVMQSITRMQWVRRGVFRKRYEQKPVKEYIATRALFPMEYTKAVRQKARWIVGIVFQEWDNTHWPNFLSVCYSLAHDRKSFVTHFINGFGYVVFLFWLLYSIVTWDNPNYPSLQEQFNLHHWVWWLVVFVTAGMVHRMVQRMIATYRVYSFIPAILAIPRTFYGNILNLHALLRAYKVFLGANQIKKTTAPIAWDKTEHYFPGSHVLVPYKRKLGDLLLENGLATSLQVEKAAILQSETAERLGDILCRLNVINKYDLAKILSKQYNLPLFPQSKVYNAQALCIARLPKKIKHLLKMQNVRVLDVEEDSARITIGLLDPTNELLIKKIIRYLVPYTVKFMLIYADV